MRESQMGPDTGNMTTSPYKVKGASRSNIKSSTGQDVSYNYALQKKPVLTSAAGTLQMLGCIPQSPSPPPSPEPTNRTDDGRAQELRALRVSLRSSRTSAPLHTDKIMQARLAKLEGTDTKAQGADSKTKIKREIGELEISDDIKITAIRSAKKIRRPGPVETIDLTAD